MADIPGGPNADLLDGTDDHDTITGGAGDDSITGLLGADLVFGGDGNDSISAMSGAADTLHGDLGDDAITAASPGSQLYGAAGNDTLTAANIGQNRLYGGTGADLLHGSLDGDQLFGGSEADTFLLDVTTIGVQAYGGSGGDTFTVIGVAGLLDGGTGRDTLAFSDFHDDVLIRMRGAALVEISSGPVLTLISVEVLHATTTVGDDTIISGGGDDRISVGTGGNDVSAGGGNDLVTYDWGQANTLRGGAGEDTLTVSGVTGLFDFTVDPVSGVGDDGKGSLISTFEAYWINLDPAGFDNRIELGAGNDLVTAAAGDDTLLGMAGDDSLTGGSGNDRLGGSSGNDTLIGDHGNDLIEGGPGNDVIWADNATPILEAAEDDSVSGGSGDDLIRLGYGRDTVTGGTGADVFQFQTALSGAHLLTDFETGRDQLQFSAATLGFVLPSGALDPALFAFGGATAAEAQFVLWAEDDGAVSHLVWDPDGTSGTEEVWLLADFSGTPGLQASDILIW